MDEVFISRCNAKPLADNLALEWLQTNGSGGYSSSTVLNCHTRKYHGLLVSKLQQPYGTFVLLSKFDDVLLVASQKFPLSTHQYLGAIEAGGYPYLENFCQDDVMAQFNYTCAGFGLSKQILIVKNTNTLLVKYRLMKRPSPGSIKISIRPFLAYREIDQLTQKNSALNQQGIESAQGVCFKPYVSMPAIQFCSNHGFSYHPEALWYYNFEYIEEKLRGYDYLEDLFTPGLIELDFSERDEIILACSIEDIREKDLSALWQEAIMPSPRGAVAAACTPLPHKPGAMDLACNYSAQTTDLCQRAKQMIVVLPNGIASIKAGYHWFGEWGRDAMIALPGLTLYNGQEEICLSVLKHFADHEHLGLIPNRIAPIESKENEYDNVDGSLWFIWAVQQYYLKTQNSDNIQTHFWHTIKNIIDHYRKGTLFNIHQLENGLIYAGTPLIKTTWMDVNINKIPLTPRNGMQVEVNGLWYNALRFTQELAAQFNDPFFSTLQPLIELVEKNYLKVFWDNNLNYLRDFVNENELNTQIRPNQIIAAALPYSPLDPPHIALILEVVTKKLFTPFGLRTLATDDPNYCGIYFGDQVSRDLAYHNGTIWPWLLGFYTQALLKVHSKQETLNLMQPAINALKKHFATQAGLGCISEIFDGDVPHHPRGCIQQAWSIAELIRLIELLTP